MARLVLHGFALAVVLGAVSKAYAQETTEDVAAIAVEAGVDATDLAGALNSLRDAGIGADARSYLIAEGELAAPVARPSATLGCGWPICGPLGQRIYCIEGIESHHGAAMFNPQPWRGEHAQGFLGWLPSTARAWGVAIGDRASEWAGAARMLAAGAGSQFFGVATGRC